MTESKRINITQGRKMSMLLLFISHKSKQLLVLLTGGYRKKISMLVLISAVPPRIWFYFCFNKYKKTVEVFELSIWPFLP